MLRRGVQCGYGARILRAVQAAPGSTSMARAAVAAALAAALVILTLTACGDGRSAKAVCETWLAEGQKINDRYENSAASADKADPLPLIGDLLGAPARLADAMHKVARVAPKDIEPAFTRLAEAFDEISKNMGKNALNPIGAVIDSLTLGFRTKGAEDEVNAYLKEHCAPK